MAYATGIATSPGEMYTAIRSFAIHQLGNFDDLFGGDFGLSSFGENTVIGLKHRPTGAAYLFDLAEGVNVNNLVGEHVLIGQLLDEVIGNSQFDANQYLGEEGVSLFPAGGRGHLTWSTLFGQSRPGSRATYDPTTFVVDVLEGPGPFSSARLGQALVLKQTVTIDAQVVTHHVFEITDLSTGEGAAGLAHSTASLPAYRQEIVATYVGSYNEDGYVAVQSTAPHPSGSVTLTNQILFSVFSALDPDILSATAFHQFTSSMWGDGTLPSDVRDGWFPRSGRLNFTSGVKYSFYGSAVIGDEYFHMVLQTEGRDQVSHWWTGRAEGGSTLSRTGLNATGMFLGTSGPHTDEAGTDTYQYPFSYQNANVAYRNPSVMITHFTETGIDDTIQNFGGGRLGYGPLGPNHSNAYGPNATRALYLRSNRYSIQTGFNSFQGGEAVGMTGARARTQYPLRPKVTETGEGFEEYYISPWAPVEATLYGLPLPEQREITLPGDPYVVPEGMVGQPATQGISINAAGWAQFTPLTSLDPQIHFFSENGGDGTSHIIDRANDRVEFLCRLKTPASGGGQIPDYVDKAQLFFTTVENPGWGTSGNTQVINYPFSFLTGAWTIFSFPVTAANFVTGHTLNGARLDPIQYSSAPTIGLKLEFAYFSIGLTEVMRNSRYCESHGAYAINIGQMPGVNRITMNKKPITGPATNSSVRFEDGHFDAVPVVKRGSVLEDQRPLGMYNSSGLAGYVYER